MRSMAAGKVYLRLCLQQVGARAVRTNPQDSAGLQSGREEESRKHVEGRPNGDIPAIGNLSL